MEFITYVEVKFMTTASKKNGRGVIEEYYCKVSILYMKWYDIT